MTYVSDDQKMFDYGVPSKFTHMASNLPPRPASSRADNYSMVPPPIPHRTYKPYASFNTAQNYSTHQDVNRNRDSQYGSSSSSKNLYMNDTHGQGRLNSPSQGHQVHQGQVQGYRHSDNLNLDPSALSWQHAQSQPRTHSVKANMLNSNPNSDFSFLPSQYRLRPCDDDDCSTTTSGSYTLHSIEDLL